MSISTYDLQEGIDYRFRISGLSEQTFNDIIFKGTLDQINLYDFFGVPKYEIGFAFKSDRDKAYRYLSKLVLELLVDMDVERIKDYLKNKIVTVYCDPVTCLHAEGKAKVIKVQDTKDINANLLYCSVKFLSDGFQTTRKLNITKL